MSVKKSHRLKSLQSRRAALKIEGIELTKEFEKYRGLLQKRDKAMHAIDSEIKELTKKEPVVSEHALLRYIERKYKIDLEKLKNEILTDDVVACIEQFNNGKYPMGDGFRAVVQNRTVVSVIEG